eukprot:9213626-Pyramimonas_sp.AAC.1
MPGTFTPRTNVIAAPRQSVIVPEFLGTITDTLVIGIRETFAIVDNECARRSGDSRTLKRTRPNPAKLMT